MDFIYRFICIKEQYYAFIVELITSKVSLKYIVLKEQFKGQLKGEQNWFTVRCDS